MNNLNELAIKTLDKLLALSDDELKSKFNEIDSSDLSEILYEAGIFKSNDLEELK